MLTSVLLWWACQGPAPETDTVVDSAETDLSVFDDDLGRVCAADVPSLPTPPVPVRSLNLLPTSNGWISATYAVDLRGVPVRFTDGAYGRTDQAHQLSAIYDHLPQRPTATTSARDLLWDAYPGVRVDGVMTWLNNVPETSAEYLPGTGIIQVVHDVGDVRVTSHWFAPFQPGAERDLVATVEVENRGTAAPSIELFQLWNAHAGGEGVADGEAASGDGEAVIEQRSGTVFRYTPIDDAKHTAAPAGDGRNPWRRATDGGDFTDDTVSGNDVAVGFEWELGALRPGTRMSRGSVFSWGDDARTISARADALVRGRTAADLLDLESNDWNEFHAAEAPPAGLDDDELRVYRQSTAVLRMAQVRESGAGHGQILASLPPGNWNIAWPRDGAYAVVGLIHAGHQQQARDYFNFIFNGHAGDYASWLGITDYLVSACRYTGDGVEESDGASCPDGSDAGPNVELDDFGLTLWAFGEYAQRWPEDPWVAEKLPLALSGIADPLVALIDPNRDLLVPDSSIWERHWETCFPNGRKHFSYSTIQAVAGLRHAADLTGDPTYATAADRLRSGLLRDGASGGPVFFETDDCPAMASAPEELCEGCGPYDGSVIDAINHGVIRPQSSLAVGTATALRRHLQMPNGSPGFLRADDGTGTTNPYPWYDDQEWVVIDLRMAEAFAKIGEATANPRWSADAATLTDWVTANARANHDLIPELLSDGRYTSEDDNDLTRPGVDLGMEYQGAAPMCGFGPGAYILAVEAVHD
jgi:GH15 family glucan-1,4-alpha-glucosidase